MSAIHLTPDEMDAVADALRFYVDSWADDARYTDHVARALVVAAKLASADSGTGSDGSARNRWRTEDARKRWGWPTETPDEPDGTGRGGE